MLAGTLAAPPRLHKHTEHEVGRLVTDCRVAVSVMQQHATTRSSRPPAIAVAGASKTLSQGDRNATTTQSNGVSGSHTAGVTVHPLVARFAVLQPQLTQLIARLRASTDPALSARMSADVASGLRELDRLLEEADAALPAMSPSVAAMDSSRSSSAWQLQMYRDVTTSLRNKYRQATLEARQNHARASSTQREELLNPLTASEQRGAATTMRKRGQTEAVKASRDLTYSMEQAVKMMQDELDRSAQLSITLQQSTQTLKDTNEEYTKYTTLLRISRGLIGSLFRKETMDRAMITVGLMVFFSVAAFIFYRRISWLIPKFGWFFSK